MFAVARTSPLVKQPPFYTAYGIAIRNHVVRYLILDNNVRFCVLGG